MSSSQFPETTSYNERLFNTVSYVLVSLMMVCVAISVILFVQKVRPEIQVGYLPVFCFLISLERLWNFKRLKRLPVLGKRWLTMLASQFVVTLFLLKIVILVYRWPDSWSRLFQLWRLDFVTYFFDSEYMVAVIFLIVIWFVSGVFAGLLDEMSLEEVLITYETAVHAPTERPPARERLVGLVFAVGIFLVILTALMRVNLRLLLSNGLGDLTIIPLPYLAAGAWNVLLYFLLGLVLLSLSQFARLNALWSLRKIPVGQKISGRWITYSLIFVLILSLIASLLPTDYSMGFLSILGYVLSFIYQFIIFLAGLVFTLIGFLFNLLMAFFGRSLPEESPSQTPQFELPPPPIQEAAPGVFPWLDFVKSLAFWLIFLAVVGFSLYQFLRQHEDALQRLRQVRGFSWLLKAWEWLRGSFRGLNQRVSETLEAGLQRLRERRERRSTGVFGRFVNPRHLSPRQRIVFFFLAMTRRGGERGLPRGVSQTPFEYAAHLKDTLPEVDADVASLTEAFVSARYSRQDVDEQQASIVKRYWDRIRGALRSRRLK